MDKIHNIWEWIIIKCIGCFLYFESKSLEFYEFSKNKLSKLWQSLKNYIKENKILSSIVAFAALLGTTMLALKKKTAQPPEKLKMD